MSLFPMYTFHSTGTNQKNLPVYQDVLMDYEKGVPVWRSGNPVLVTGLEAVKGWVWRALKTARYRHSVFSWSYGCELDALVGQSYRADTKLSEASRYVQEALLVNPYIKEVRMLDSHFEGSMLRLTVSVTTVYGGVTVSV